MPVPPIRVNGAYPKVDKPYYTVCAKTSSTSFVWWAPVFLCKPRCVATKSETLIMDDAYNTEIKVFVLSAGGKELPASSGPPRGFALLQSRPCILHEPRSSSEEIQRQSAESIRVNIQNGTWCNGPMSASEAMEADCAMHDVKYVYSAAGCC